MKPNHFTGAIAKALFNRSLPSCTYKYNND